MKEFSTGKVCMSNKKGIIITFLLSLIIGICVCFAKYEYVDMTYENNTYVCDINYPSYSPWYKEKININKAGADLLSTIPGIGEKRAEDIIAYREENGGFDTIEDIMKIRGIGVKTFENIKNYICN